MNDKNNKLNSDTNISDKKTFKVSADTKQKIVRGLITLAVTVGVCLVVFLILYASGVLKKIDSVESLTVILQENKRWSYAIFVIIQFMQVVFLPIPAMLTTLAGVQLFGALETFVLSLFAVILGSIFAFWLGRQFGRRLIVWIVGEEDAKKWGGKIEKGKYTFFLMMLFPGFPDDILCILAGATPMTYRFFITTNLITRPIVFASICFLSSGLLIPYTGWGIPVWIVLGLLMIYAFYFSIRYPQKIENFIDKILLKFKKDTNKDTGYGSVKDNYNEFDMVKNTEDTEEVLKDINGKVLVDDTQQNVIQNKTEANKPNKPKTTKTETIRVIKED